MLLADLTVRTIHESWAWVVVVGNALAGVWALAAHRLEVLRVKQLWWFVAAAEASIVVQIVLGAIMVGAQGIQATQFHMFYGFIALITVGLIYSYRQQLAAHLYLLYGFGGLFLMGLGIRAMVLHT